MLRRRTAFEHVSIGRRVRWLVAWAAVLGGMAGILPPWLVTAATANPSSNPFCQQHLKQASAGALLYCHGPQASGPSPALSPSRGRSSNVNAASFTEDRTTTGVQARGQSETSIAANGSYVVEAWNDSTGFYASCGDPQNKEELTGYGFSSNGGASFTDMGGLPNANCRGTRYYGDPSVETWTSGGTDYFYISSLFFDTAGNNAIAVAACEVTGGGSGATLSCGQPTEMAVLTSGFLDKDFIALDRQRGQLYVVYTDFAYDNSTVGQIELASCDVGTPSGQAGSLGGTAAAPVCPQPATNSPYLVVAPGDPNCVQTGAYPAVDPSNGDLYVSWEYNWTSSFQECTFRPTREEVAYIPSACLTLSTRSPGCTSPAVTTSVQMVSLANENVPGYEANAVNDFPRIAVSRPFGTVSLVYNAGDQHPSGDIFLQSFAVQTLTPIQKMPVRLNSDVSTPFKLLPALRVATPKGDLPVSWYDRRLGNGTALTDVYAATVNPRTTTTPRNVRITSVSTDWLNTYSDIVPNFGDYTDNIIGVGSGVSYYAWSDGRSGEPQPYEAHTRSAN